jgi:hypothetical protein
MHLSAAIDDWELGTKAQRLWAEPAFGPHFARLVYAEDPLEWRAGTSLMHAIASDVRSGGPSKVALVAQNEPVLTGFKQYAENLMGIPARVFQTIEEAIAWLGVRLPEPWPPEEH